LNSKIDRINSLISHIEDSERAIICSVFEEWGRGIVEEQKREREWESSKLLLVEWRGNFCVP